MEGDTIYDTMDQFAPDEWRNILTALLTYAQENDIKKMFVGDFLNALLDDAMVEEEE